MTHKKIIFVCSGNTCRSPMAEAVLRTELKRRKIRWYAISSAGINAQPGAPMAEQARAVLAERSIACPENFRARRLTPKMVRDAYAVICMTREQASALGQKNVKNMWMFTGKDIPDPYGKGIEEYRAVLTMIADSIPKIIAILDIGNEN